MDAKLTIVEHLNELRKRIIICLILLGMATVISLPFASQILKILKLPAGEYINTLAFFKPQEAFLVYMKVAFLCGIIIALPAILYEIWAFISPAVERGIKRYTLYFILCGSLIFIIGGLFAYFILLPKAIKFLLSFQGDILQPVISAREYISFVVSIILGCGLIFQMPVLSFILTKAGLINARVLRRKARWAILIIFIIAAIITPTTDAFNLLIFALPMLVLYEVSIWVAYWAR